LKKGEEKATNIERKRWALVLEAEFFGREGKRGGRANSAVKYALRRRLGWTKKKACWRVLGRGGEKLKFLPGKPRAEQA